MANLTRFIETKDSHTAGEGTRLVTGGLPPIPGQSMADKLAYASRELAWLPGYLLQEPRGHQDLFGAVLVPPCDPQADIGVLFMDNQGFEPMCGHAVIGTVTTLLETGTFPAREPETSLALDTPAGLVKASARVRRGRVESVAFQNVPSFVYQAGLRLPVPPFGELQVDIVFGGLFFVFVDARQIDLPLVPASAARLARLGMDILARANRQVQVRHPLLPHIDRIMDLRFYVEPGEAGADSRNVVILGDHMVDRSPCGTGTSAETALRHARGQLAVGESFVTESLLGTTFRGRAVALTTVGEGEGAFPAVIPEITGSAYLTGFHRFVLAEGDPFPNGFLLRQ